MDTNMIVLVVTVTIVICCVAFAIWLVKVVRGMRGPAFTGAPVEGTGQVTSVQETGDSSGPEYGDESEVVCHIALRVHLPDLPPYDATMRRLVPRSALPSLRPGAAVVVAADSANLQNVRIVFTQPDHATWREQRRQNWSAIDSLVQEFIPEAIRRHTRTQGVLGDQWLVRSSQSERDHLVIKKDGSWHLRGEDNGYIVELTTSVDPNKIGPRTTDAVEGLREGAMRLLN